MKNSKNFSSYDELINYYGSVENIPSNVLAVVEDQGSQVLFSVSNNLSQSGEQYNEGGYNLDEEDREKLDYSYTTVQEIELSYASKDYVADYVSQHGPDLTGYATESYVVGKIEDVVGVAPAALDTLKEIADSLNNDADFAGTMTVALSNKADKSELNSYVSTSSLESMGYATQSYVVDYVNTYGGGSSVQADWNESDSSSDSYILNKPEQLWNKVGDGIVSAFSTGYKSNVGENSVIISTSPYADRNEAASKNTLVIGSNLKSKNNLTANSILCGINSEINCSNSILVGSSSKMNMGDGAVFGSLLESNGEGNLVSGWGNTTYNKGEFSTGIYNKSTSTSSTQGDSGNTQFTVGIGSAANNRKNAFEIMQNGDLYAYGIGNYDGTNYSSAYTLAYVINNINNLIGSAADLAETIVGENDSNSDSNDGR